MIERISRILKRKFVKDTIALQIGKSGVLAVSLAGSIVIPRLMQPEAYGQWQLIVTLYSIWQLLDLTGLTPSAHTRLPEAVGARDEAGILRYMAFYLRTALLYSALSTLVLLALNVFTPLAEILYPNQGNAGDIVTLAVILTLRRPTDLLFMLLMTTFSSRRQMSRVAVLQSMNQIVLTVCGVIAVIVLQKPIALVIGQLVYSLLTFSMVAVYYQRTRQGEKVAFPSLWDVLRSVNLPYERSELGFGFTNAVDKNLSSLFTLLPIQITGRLFGDIAAGHLGLASNIVRQGNFFASSVLDNMRAVVPQAVGKREYKRLWNNLRQVMRILGGAALVLYGAIAIISPFAVPLLYSTDFAPAIVLVQILAIHGVMKTVGGVLGPLYRVFNFMRGILIIRVVTLAIGVPLGWWLIVQYGAVGGAWMVVLLFGIQIPLTALLTMPELRRRAQAPAVT